MTKIFLAALAAVSASLSFYISEARASDRCERACLENMIDRVIEAMAAHDPSHIPWQRDAKYTENGQELHLGDGLWGTGSGHGNYKIYISDTEAEQAGYLGTMFENGAPILVAIRLKIEFGLVREAEVIAARNAFGSFPPPGKILEEGKAPRAQFSRTVPEGERLSRAELIRIADSYFTGLGGNTGRNIAPFAPTCERLENALQTTNSPRPDQQSGIDILGMNCEDQQKSGWFAFVTEIRNRRHEVIDRERGLVLSFAFFDHHGRKMDMQMPDGSTAPNPLSAPTTFEIAEIFQIDKGKIDQIEAVINTVPYRMKSDLWDE